MDLKSIGKILFLLLTTYLIILYCVGLKLKISQLSLKRTHKK